MDRQDHSCPLGDGGLDLARVDLKSVDIGIHEDRQSMEHQDRIDRGHEGVRRNDDFIARLDAQGTQGCQQGTGAVCCRRTVLGAGQPCVLRFKTVHDLPVTAKPFASLQNVEQGLFLPAVHDRPGGETVGACVEGIYTTAPADVLSENDSRVRRAGAGRCPRKRDRSAFSPPRIRLPRMPSVPGSSRGCRWYIP